MESEEVVWTGSGTILPHELKECNLEMTCPQHEPSVLALLRVHFWGLCFFMYAVDTVIYFTNLCTSEITKGSKG